MREGLITGHVTTLNPWPDGMYTFPVTETWRGVTRATF